MMTKRQLRMNVGHPHRGRITSVKSNLNLVYIRLLPHAWLYPPYGRLR
jgi:hypothetical protein